MTTKLHLKAPFLPVLTILLLTLQVTSPSPAWMSLLISLGGFFLICSIWAISLARNLSIQREMRFGWAQVGDKLEERFTFSNQGFFPATWAELIDHSTLPGYDASQATSIGPRETNHWSTRGVCTQRGVFRLGNTSLNTGDPFGIYMVSITDPSSAVLMITPPVVPLPGIEITPGGIQGTGRPRTNAPEKSVSANGVREYVTGDSLRLIHWPTTARKGKQFVRLFDGTPSADWWILLDMDRNVQVGQGWESSEELGIILAASLADRGLKARESVGLVSSTSQVIWLPPRNLETQRLEIMRSLATASPGEYSLPELLERVRPSLKGQGASLILITASTRSEWIQTLLPLQRVGIRPTILLIDPATFDEKESALPLAARLQELGLSVHVLGRDLLELPEARPGYQGQWEWQLTPSGKAVPVRLPGNIAWKKLS